MKRLWNACFWSLLPKKPKYNENKYFRYYYHLQYHMIKLSCIHKKYNKSQLSNEYHNPAYINKKLHINYNSFPDKTFLFFFLLIIFMGKW